MSGYDKYPYLADLDPAAVERVVELNRKYPDWSATDISAFVTHEGWPVNLLQAVVILEVGGRS